MARVSEVRNNAVAKGPNFLDRAAEVLSEIECMDTSHLPTQDTDFIDRAANSGYISESAFNALQRILSRLRREARRGGGGYGDADC